MSDRDPRDVVMAMARRFGWRRTWDAVIPACMARQKRCRSAARRRWAMRLGEVVWFNCPDLPPVEA